MSKNPQKPSGQTLRYLNTPIWHSLLETSTAITLTGVILMTTKQEKSSVHGRMTQTCTYSLTQKNLVLSDQPEGNVTTHPDLCFVTTNNNLEPLNADRKVPDNFPHSQHRLILITVGMNIPTVQSIPTKSTMELPKRQLGKLHLRH